MSSKQEASVVLIRGLSRLSMTELDVVLAATVGPVWAAKMKNHIVNRHIRFSEQEWDDEMDYMDNGRAAMRGVL